MPTRGMPQQDPVDVGDPPGEQPGQLVRLGVLSRSWRVLVLLAITALFLLGSIVGQDSWWPFSPWRMFSTSTPPTGSVVAMAIEVRTADDPTWRPAGLTPSSIGLNRAEVEGRIPQITADPTMLGTIAHSRSRLHPSAAAWVGVRLIRRETVIVDRRPTGEVRSTLVAEWEAP